MTKAGAHGSAGKAGREGRLAKELRANLARRKAQARSRRTGAADERPEGLGATKDTRRGGAAGQETES
jgi:hypothetical protein